MIKRLTSFSLLLAAALLCLLVPQRAQAAQAEQEATITVKFDQEQYTPGETAMVQIRVAAVDSAIDLSGLEFQLSDAEGLELQTLTMAIGSTGSGVSDASAASGRGIYCQYGTETLTVDKDGILVAEAAYLVTGQPGDTVQLGLDEWMLLQADGAEISAGQQGGQALILPNTDPDAPTLTLSVDHAVCKAGDIITVTLSLTGEEASYEIYGLEDTIAFDPACFELLPDSIVASIGSASGKKTGEVYDRVYFMRFGTVAETVSKGASLVTFRLRVLEGGTIWNKRPVRSDAIGSVILPLNLQDTAVSLYDLEHQPPLAWITGGTDLILRNYSDDSVTASLWLACYGPGGQMRSVSLLARQALDGGEQMTVPREDAAAPAGETAKLLVTGEGCIPLSKALELK